MCPKSATPQTDRQTEVFVPKWDLRSDCTASGEIKARDLVVFLFLLKKKRCDVLRAFESEKLPLMEAPQADIECKSRRITHDLKNSRNDAGIVRKNTESSVQVKVQAKSRCG